MMLTRNTLSTEKGYFWIPEQDLYFFLLFLCNFLKLIGKIIHI